jgi:heme/copper-type cytochrome/quinol oxidase subunit 2
MSGRMFSKQRSLCVLVFVVVVVVVVVVASLVGLWLCSAKFNTQPYLEDEHGSIAFSDTLSMGTKHITWP